MATQVPTGLRAPRHVGERTAPGQGNRDSEREGPGTSSGTNVLGSSILGSVLSLTELSATRYYLFMYFQDSEMYTEIETFGRE